jgi:hypothetical protein
MAIMKNYVGVFKRIRVCAFLQQENWRGCGPVKLSDLPHLEVCRSVLQQSSEFARSTYPYSLSPESSIYVVLNFSKKPLRL